MRDPKNNTGTFLHIIGIIAIVIILVAICILVIIKLAAPNCVGLSDANLTIVLSFIGVLATFIVIGNYAQVSDIRRSMEQEMDKKKLAINNLYSTIDHLKDKTYVDLEKSNSNLIKLKKYTDKHISDLKDTIEEQSDNDRRYTIDEVRKLQETIKEYKCLVLNVSIAPFGEIGAVMILLHKLSIYAENGEFSLVLKNPKKAIKAKVQINDGGFDFYAKNEHVDELSIVSIDGICINSQTLYGLYQLYEDIITPDSQKEYSNSDEFSTDSDDTTNTNDNNSIDIAKI